MVQLVTRQVGATAKGSALTVAELDQNFVNLNDGAVNSTASNTTINSKLTEISLDATAENAAKALHRSPNNITAMFIYDTSKDSDGGAWTTKCQNTSWYNETLSGKWLGRHDSELNARNHNPILGEELVSTANSASAWSVYGANTVEQDGEAVKGTYVNNTSGLFVYLRQNQGGLKQNLQTSKLYQLTFDLKAFNGAIQASWNDGSSQNVITFTLSPINDFTKIIFNVTVSSAGNPYLRIQEMNANESFLIKNISVREIIKQTTQSNDYFQLTTDGKFYKLNETSGITEVFRGNKRDFPKLAGIVAEASNVTIYDLTEPNNPMWMRFLNTGNSASALSAATGGGTPNISSLSAANSILGVGSNGGVALFNFSKDDCVGARTTTTRVPKDRAVVFRNSQSGNALNTGDGFTLSSNNINQVSIKVLPNSIKDPVTNLEIPIILAAQNLGVSIIKSNGTVVNNTGASELISIDFNEKLFIGTSYDASWYQLNPEFLTSFDHYSYLIQRNSFPDYYRQIWQYNNKLIKKTQVISSGSNLISTMLINLANKSKNLTSIITNTYNTSWQVGDIRRTYLSDITQGSSSSSIADVSYKNKQAIVNGTLTRSAVAAGAQLVGYSGWSDSNYIQEAYSSELDFGTGEWNVSAWFKTPVGARVNLLTYSEQFDNGVWAKTNTTVSVTKVTDPLGGTTAQQLYETAVTAVHNVSQGVNLALGVSFVSSCYVKANGRNFAWIGVTGGAARLVVAIDLTTGQLSSVVDTFGNYAGISSSATNIGNGWWLLSLTARRAAGGSDTGSVDIGISDSLTPRPSYAGDITKGIYIWGADLRLVTDSPNTYQKVVSGSETFNALLVDRSYLGGPRIALNMTATGALQAIAYDGTTTNTVTTTLTYANNTWIKAEANYLNGRLSINVNGVEVVSNAAAPLLSLNSRYNLLMYTEQFDTAWWTKNACSVSANTSATTDPLGGNTADKLIESATNADHYVSAISGIIASLGNQAYTNSVYAKAAERSWATVYIFNGATSKIAWFDLVNGVVGTVQSGATASIQSVGNGWYRCSITWATAPTGTANGGYAATIGDNVGAYLGDGTSGIYIWGADLRVANTGTGVPYQRVTNVPETFIAPLTIGNNPTPKGLILGPELVTNGTFDTDTTGWTAGYSTLSVLSGSLVITNTGVYFGSAQQSVSTVAGKTYKLTCNFVRGTSSRVYLQVGTTPAAFDLGYDTKTTANGTLQVVFRATQITSYISAFNGEASVGLTNSFDNISVREVTGSYINESFPGSLALVKLSATVPTLDQSLFMYEQEKQMFRSGAQVCLPDSNTISELAYDDTTDRWFAATSANESQWSSLVRVANTSGSYSKVISKSNYRLTASGGNANLTSPVLELKEQSFKNRELVNLVNNDLITLDYVGGFTANITNGSGVLASVANQSIPSSTILNGALIEGTGIPASTTLVASNHLSTTATATTTGLQINFRDFILPIGYETKAVLVAGSLKQEGSTKDYTRLFDGFREIIRFNTAPGNTAWVQIKAAKIA